MKINFQHPLFISMPDVVITEATKQFVRAAKAALDSGKYEGVRQLADALDYNYGNLSSVLNGGRNLPEKYFQKAKEILVFENSPSAIPIDLGDRLIISVPLVYQYAYAGYLTGFGDPEYVESLPTTPFIVDKEPKGNYIAFEVKGDSMDNGTSDSYLQGDVLLCREVKRDLWRSKLHIKKWDFVVVHRTKGVVIKRINSHDTGNGHLTLHSLNPMYDDFQVQLDDILQLFNVVQVMRKK